MFGVYSMVKLHRNRREALLGAVLCCIASALPCSGSGPGVNATVADGRYPNLMIPVWKQRMFDRANNLTESGIQEFLQAASAGLAYRLVAYQGCRIIGVLSNLEREKYGDELRDRLARHGALETITKAMGAHLVSRPCAMWLYVNAPRRRASAASRCNSMQP